MSDRPSRTTKTKTKAKRGPRPWWKRLRWRRVVLLAVLALFALFFISVGALYAFGGIPDPKDVARAQSVAVVDQDGRTIGRIHAAADRVSIPLEQMPQHLRDAVIATEDRRFYTHAGVSVPSIFRAALSNALGRGRQGGSTITQQYVKNAFVGNEQTIWRKVKEAVIAVKVERRRSKDEILELYLNTIYFGRGAYGCEAAALAYYGRHCRDLDLQQSATLAGLIKAPETYDPTRNPDAALARRNAVLGFMVRDEHITQQEADRVREMPLAARRRAGSRFAAHYLEEVQRIVEEEIGPARLYGGGVRITATLDRDMQLAAEKAVREVWTQRSDPEVALVAIEPETGAVRALVGSRDYAQRELNIAVRSRRQPGSTFKPAVLAAAFDEGISPNRRYPAPATIRIPGYPKPVSNYDRRGYGSLTVAEATWHSVNTVYMQLIQDAGARNVAAIAKRLGISSPLDPVAGLALGVEEVSPLELTSMFATFGARGMRREPVFVEKVTIRGKTVYEAEALEERAVDEAVADNVNAVLQGVVRNGTGRRASIGRPSAGKTGTTQENVDAWFAGYTPDLATVVWNGFPERQRSLRDVRSRTGGCTASVGGSCPAEVWQRFMREALEGVPPTPFAKAAVIADPGDGDDADASASATPEPQPTRSRIVAPPSSPATEPDPVPSPSPTLIEESPSPEPSPTGGT